MKSVNHPPSDMPAGLPPAVAVDRFAAAPDGYFDELQRSIATRLAGEVPLRGILAQPEARQDWLAAPDGYFASLPGRIVSRVQRGQLSPLARVRHVLLSPNLSVALPVVLAGVMIGTGWWAMPNQAPQAEQLALALPDDLPREALLAELQRDLDHVDPSLLVEYAAPLPAPTPQTVAAPINLDQQALEDYLTRTSTTSELIDALEPEPDASR